MLLIHHIISKSCARPRFYLPQLHLAHTDLCPRKARRAVKQDNIKRPEYGGKVRFGFIPDEWFQFFYPMTGVSGPYFFGILLTNYLVSKEIYVLEHEYYIGISIFVILYYVTTRFGKTIGKALDKQVDEYANGFEKVRSDEIKYYENILKDLKDSQLKAGAQKLLMDAKKENVAMQLEAAYRDRMMLAYQTIKSRLDYQVKLHQSLAKIHQKWMIQWILENVKKSITPDVEKKLVDTAINEISSLGDKVQRT